MQKEKRPPINLRDMQQEPDQPKAQPGELGYAMEGTKKEKQGNGKVSEGGNVRNTIIGVVIAVVVAVFATYAIAPWGRDMRTLQDNQKDLDSRMAGVTTALNSSASKLDNVINTQGNYAQKTDVAAVSSALSTLKSSTDGFGSSVASLTKVVEDSSKTQKATLDGFIAQYKSDIASFTTKLAEKDSKIVQLEGEIASIQAKLTTVPSGTSPAGVVTAKVKQMSSSLLPQDDDTLSASIRVTLTNTTASAVSDIVLELSILTEMIGNYSSCTLTGGGTVWQGQGVPWQQRNFMNTQWGLNLAANETKNLYLTLTVTGGSGATYLTTYVNGVAFDASVNVE